jgi:hypothetical protein
MAKYRVSFELVYHIFKITISLFFRLRYDMRSVGEMRVKLRLNTFNSRKFDLAELNTNFQ